LPLNIDIANFDDGWGEAELEPLCEDAILNCCAVLGKDVDGEVSIAFVDDTRIRELNKGYRNKDKATNVLSFPMSGDMLGDIVLSRETIAREAGEQGKSLKDHLTHLIIHGFLHLLGYDHMDEKSAAEMETIEIQTLAQLGIDNPYELNEPK